MNTMFCWVGVIVIARQTTVIQKNNIVVVIIIVERVTNTMYLHVLIFVDFRTI